MKNERGVKSKRGTDTRDGRHEERWYSYLRATRFRLAVMLVA